MNKPNVFKYASEFNVPVTLGKFYWFIKENETHSYNNN